MKIYYKKIVQIIISATIIAALIKYINYQQLKRILANVDSFYLALSFLIILADRVLMPVKWNLLLIAKSIDIGVFSAIRIYFISSFLGLSLPPTVGADTVRAFYVKRIGFSYADIISSIIVERLIGLISLFIFGIAGCLFFLNFVVDLQIRIRFLLIVVIIGSAATIFFLLASLNPFISLKAIALLKRSTKMRFLGRIFKGILLIYNSYVDYNQHKFIIFNFFVLTCIEVCLPIVRGYIVAMAFGINKPLLYFFAFVPINQCLIRLPISINGFGVHEASYIYFLSVVGVPETIGFSIGVVNHLVALVGIMLGGIFYMFKKDNAKRKFILGDIKNK